MRDDKHGRKHQQLGSGADGGSNTDIIQALRLSAANSLNQAGQQVVQRNLNIQPTLTIRPASR
jgi:type IV secretory pathway VirB10-like protein